RRMSDENWLTSTVSSLCNEMRATGEYSLLNPHLHDALLDADCKDEEILRLCLEPLSPIQAQRLVCLVLGGELAESVRWLEYFCDQFRNSDFPDDYEYDYNDPEKNEANRVYGPCELTYELLIAGTTSGEGFFHGFDTPEIVYEEGDKLNQCLARVTGRDI